MKTFALRASHILTLSATLLTGCAGSKIQKTANLAVDSPNAQATNWYVISDDAVKTYFPKGLPRDAKTDFNHGSWVSNPGVRWWIPADGAGGRSHTELAVEAIAIRGPAQPPPESVRTKKPTKKKPAGEIACKSVGTGVLLCAEFTFGLMCVLGGGWLPESTLEEFWDTNYREEWRKHWDAEQRRNRMMEMTPISGKTGHVAH